MREVIVRPVRAGDERLTEYLDGSPDRGGYLAWCGDAPVGFALVRGLTGELRTLGEFFVVRAVRRHGVGHRVTTDVVRRHPGTWQVAFQDTNPAGAPFWRRWAAEVAPAGWSEEARPVPGKPDAPPDCWITLTVGQLAELWTAVETPPQAR